MFRNEFEERQHNARLSVALGEERRAAEAEAARQHEMEQQRQQTDALIAWSKTQRDRKIAEQRAAAAARAERERRVTVWTLQPRPHHL